MNKFRNSAMNAVIYAVFGFLALGIVIGTVVALGVAIMFMIGWVSR